MRIEGIVTRPKGRKEEKDQRRKRELDNHVETSREERERKDVLRLSVPLLFLEHPFVVDRNRYGEKIPVVC